MTIIALAAAALAAITAFTRTPEGVASTGGDTSLVKIRRSTSVVLALAEGLWTLLDALAFVTGRRVASAAGRSAPLRAPGFGSQAAGDASD